QHGPGAPLVGGAGLAAYPAVRLQPRDGVRKPASRRMPRVGELTHPEPAAGCFGKRDEDLVVRVRHARVVLQLTLEVRAEHAGGHVELTPDALLVVAEPSGFGHTPIIPLIEHSIRFAGHGFG